MATPRILIAIVLIAVAYFIYTNFGVSEGLHAQAPLISAPLPLPAMTLSSSGPNPPSQMAEHHSRAETVEARDPYAETADDAHAPERITHPENYYGPGIVPESSSNKIGVDAGVASYESEPGPYNSTLYSPEQIGNGAASFDGIIAMEPTHGISYSVL